VVYAVKIAVLAMQNCLAKGQGLECRYLDRRSTYSYQAVALREAGSYQRGGGGEGGNRDKSRRYIVKATTPPYVFSLLIFIPKYFLRLRGYLKN
jgi:hypothetical protein